MLSKCSVCGYTLTDEIILWDKCPKCVAPLQCFNILTAIEADRIRDSERTNQIHNEIIELATRIRKLASEGIKLGLDDPCISVFTKAFYESLVIKQRSKAELAGHVIHGKW